MGEKLIFTKICEFSENHYFGSQGTSKSYKYDKEYFFNILDNLKDKRISKVFRLRYFDESKENKKPTWSFIAKKINTSTQTAINLYNRGKKMLHKKITSTDSQDMI